MHQLNTDTAILTAFNACIHGDPTVSHAALWQAIATAIARGSRALTGAPLRWCHDTLARWYRAEKRLTADPTLPADERIARLRLLLANDLSALDTHPTHFKTRLSRRLSALTQNIISTYNGQKV